MKKILVFLLLILWPSMALAGRYLLEAEIILQKTPARLVEVWVPLPLEDETQKVEQLIVKAPGPYLITREDEYGNRFLYLRLKGEPARITYQAVVRRKEFSPRPASTPPPLRLLLPDRLVPVETFRDLALELTKEAKTPREKLFALYDFVVTNLRYDKSGQGWGRGDALFACKAKRGNCTDFHSLLMALSRAVGIPSLFEIGLPVPEGGGKISGYHCWLKVYLDGKILGLDASEAAKHPEKKTYFFGHLCDRRILLTRGRDLLLSPAQHGARLNFMYQAYAERDLKPAPSLVHTTYRVKFLPDEAEDSRPPSAPGP